ncbi:tyrosine kinase [Escherichia coli]|nr:tyrosine kinase [Escherichia coli]
MSLTYTGEDREQIRDILNSIARNYQEQNIERKSAEASKSLAFLAQQLPEVRSRLDVAENKLNAFRQDKDSVESAAGSESGARFDGEHRRAVERTDL